MTNQMLNRLGYPVTSTVNPAKALARFKLKPKHFDLIIPDMTMPQMNGIQFAEKLMAVRQDIPNTLCTGHSSLIDEAKAKKMGIAGLVMKPIVKQEIANTIRKILDNNQTR